MGASVGFLSKPKALLIVSEPAKIVSISSLIVKYIKVLPRPADRRQENQKGSHALIHASLKYWNRVIADLLLLYHEFKEKKRLCFNI